MTADLGKGKFPVLRQLGFYEFEGDTREFTNLLGKITETHEKNTDQSCLTHLDASLYIVGQLNSINKDSTNIGLCAK